MWTYKEGNLKLVNSIRWCHLLYCDFTLKDKWVANIKGPEI